MSGKVSAPSPRFARPGITPSRIGRWVSASSPTSRSRARYLQKHHGIGKVAIVDFDVHHGNGTQAAFEADPSVLFISLHQHPRTLLSRQRLRMGKRRRRWRQGSRINSRSSPASGEDEYLQALTRA